MELGLTKLLQRAVQIKPTAPAAADPFFGWTASWNGQELFCIHDQSGIGFVYSGALTELNTAVTDGIRICLEQMQVRPDLIGKYLSDLGEIRYCKVRSSLHSGRVGNFSRKQEACQPCRREHAGYRVRMHSDCVTVKKKRRTVADLFAAGMTKKYRTKKVFYGEHEAARYAARPLPTSRIYAGYQFYAKLTYDDFPVDACFRYTALTVLDWLKERMGGTDLPQELQSVSAARFAELDNSDLKSISGGDYRIVSVPVQGTWALWLREPHPKIIGRSFITNAAVHILNDREVELGIRIDIQDRSSSVPEADAAYRPKFLRLLFMTPGLRLWQSTQLLYKDYTVLENKRALTGFFNLMSQTADLLPLIVFTHAQEKLPEQELSLPKLPNAEMLPPINLLQERKNVPLLFNKDFKMTESKLPLPVKKGAYKSALPVKNTANPPQVRNYLPYDASEFSSHTYGFGKVFVLQADLFEEFRKKLRQPQVKPGDILLIEPAAFGGSIRVFPYRPGLNSKAYSSFTESILETLRCYSKHKPYTFGNVVFAENAQSIVRQTELEQMRLQLFAAKTEREAQLLETLEQENQRSGDLLREIENLRKQLSAEYQRGAASERSRSESLEYELAEVKAQNIDLQEKNDRLSEGYDEVKGIRDSLAAVRGFDQLPQTCAEIVEYYRKVFSDRLDFTDQGARTAEKCDIKPSVLWESLYKMATDLLDLHRRNASDIETEFKKLAGLEVSMSEGSQTRSNPKLMALRKDSYEGREISIEPHLKLAKAAKKTGAAFQRIYYCYDDKTRKMIIGWVGDHLDNHSTLNFS